MSVHFSSAKQLALVLSRNQGCRLGETSVVSHKVHTIDPTQPETVHIVGNADAGRIFYKRKKLNEIVHVDIFHSLNRLNPKPLADAARTAVENYARALSLEAGMHFSYGREIYSLANFIDIQTGAGGGRVTGKLSYGLKESLKKAHENHVHFTLLLQNKDLALVFFLIEQVERALKQAGAELRMIERLAHSDADHTKHDISAYRAYTDSFLRENRQEKSVTKDDHYRHQLLDIADILEEIDDLNELNQILHKAHPVINKRGAPVPQDAPYFWQFQPKLSDAWNKLQGYGYVERVNDRYLLTDDGQRLYDFLHKCGRQIECDLKQQHRGGNKGLASTAKGYGHASYNRRKAQGKQAILKRTVGTGTIAVIPTVIHSLRESMEAERAWRIYKRNLHYEERVGRHRLDICLLIDASASMMGKRMKAAKVLAEHLVHSTDDRLSVVYFQEDKVEIAVPFTRNQTLLKTGLRAIKPSGLTPLALGLLRASEFIQRHSSPKQSLLVCITDGIPTMALNSGDPLQEALEQAKDIGNLGICLCCVGLQPNHKLLDRLAQAAGGSVHIIDEITAPELLRIVEKERKEAVRNL